MKNISIESNTVRTLKRNQLIRSFDSVVKEYPNALKMGREQTADHLLLLEEEGQIVISFETMNSIIMCKIDWIS
jgi:hypothetical protein